MLRLLTGLSLALGLGLLAAPAAAQGCKTHFEVGDYVLLNGSFGYVDQPGYVTKVLEYCRYEARAMLGTEQGGSTFPYPYGEDYVTPMAGEPPNHNPGGCPFAADDEVDYQVQPAAWVAGVVRKVDPTLCTTDITYTLEGHELEESLYLAGMDGATLLRARTAESTAAADGAKEDGAAHPEEAAAACQGESFTTVADADPDAAVKRAMLTMYGGDSDPDLYVKFTSIRKGKSFTVGDPSTFLSSHTDAEVGGTATPYRIELTICSKTRNDTGKADFYCYGDNFGDLVCKQ